MSSRVNIILIIVFCSAIPPIGRFPGLQDCVQYAQSCRCAAPQISGGATSLGPLSFTGAWD